MHTAKLAAGVESQGDTPTSPRIAGVVIAGVALAGASATITFGTTASPLGAIVRALMVATPVGVGAYAWRRRPTQRFGLLLMLSGFGWFLSTLSESGDPVVYSVGRVSGWVMELSLIYLVLSFPTGRIRERQDRIVVWAGIAMVVALYLPSVFLADAFPQPTPVSSCHRSCPTNAFMIAGSEPHWAESVLGPARELLTILLFATVLGRVTIRIRRATPVLRRTLVPMLAVVLLHLALFGGAIAARVLDPGGPMGQTIMWCVALTLPGLAASFGLGLVWQRAHVADAASQLGKRMDSRSAGLEGALAVALGDPSIQIIVGDSPRHSPEAPGRRITEVEHNGQIIALMVHDAALLYEPDLIEVGVSFARVALSNERLAAEVRSSSVEIARSRSRIQAAADYERRRIERDLHDGAQQRLVALRIQLELTEELLRQDPEKGLIRLHTLGAEVTDTLNDIRSIAQGVYPPLLAERGLAEALTAAALRSATQTQVNPYGLGRYQPAIESAVYFCCLEALQNAAKHAPGALVVVDLRQDGRLYFDVTDHGKGFDVAARSDGQGLINMRDRLEAVGGRLVVRSAAGRGSVVSGSVPLDDS